MIGIVVTTWNTLNFLRQMVKTIRTRHPHVIIVVDNNSSDGVDEWVKARMAEEPSRWQFIKQTEYGSMGHNRNAGVKLAVELGCSHIILSQEDLLLHRDCIDNLVEVYERKRFLLTAAVSIDPSTSDFWSKVTKPINEQLGYDYIAYHDDALMRANLDGLLEVSPKIMLELDRLTGKESYDAPAHTVNCISRSFVDEVGYYDDGFTEGDVENNDLIHRCNLVSGSWENRRAWSCQLSLFFHWGGGSFLTNNLALAQFKDKIFIDSYERYRRKWGGDLNAERWTTPIPQPSLWNTKNTYMKLSRKADDLKLESPKHGVNHQQEDK